jgi:hypothetical protein
LASGRLHGDITLNFIFKSKHFHVITMDRVEQFLIYGTHSTITETFSTAVYHSDDTIYQNENSYWTEGRFT